MPQELAQLLAANALPPLLILLCILLLYLLLGCVMDSLSMILLTIPIFFPLVMGLDFGLGQEEAAIWFGILVLVVVEVGLITPPVGMNVFVINSLADGVPMRDTFAGIVPFLISDLARIALLITFPGISLGLVRLFA
jgi:TRAP-type C4-dicarboxylate transport system permease large subunit